MTPELRAKIEEMAQLNYHEAGFQRTAYLRGAKDMFKLMIDECRLRKLDEALIVIFMNVSNIRRKHDPS